jgi:hypothetical protein
MAQFKPNIISFCLCPLLPDWAAATAPQDPAELRQTVNSLADAVETLEADTRPLECPDFTPACATPLSGSACWPERASRRPGWPRERWSMAHTQPASMKSIPTYGWRRRHTLSTTLRCHDGLRSRSFPCHRQCTVPGRSYRALREYRPCPGAVRWRNGALS